MSEKGKGAKEVASSGANPPFPKHTKEKVTAMRLSYRTPRGDVNADLTEAEAKRVMEILGIETETE